MAWSSRWRSAPTGKVKARIVVNDERSTNVVFRTFHNAARLAKNSISDEVLRTQGEGGEFEDVRHLVAGARGGCAAGSGGSAPSAEVAFHR